MKSITEQAMDYADQHLDRDTIVQVVGNHIAELLVLLRPEEREKAWKKALHIVISSRCSADAGD